MLYILFRLSRKFAVQCFQLRSLLCPITIIEAAIATDFSAFEDIFPHTNERASQYRVNRRRHDARAAP
jgi:hypothetical protein